MANLSWIKEKFNALYHMLDIVHTSLGSPTYFKHLKTITSGAVKFVGRNDPLHRQITLRGILRYLPLRLLPPLQYKNSAQYPYELE